MHGVLTRPIPRRSGAQAAQVQAHNHDNNNNNDDDDHYDHYNDHI